MSNVLNQLLAQGIKEGVALAEADKASILAEATRLGITVENVADAAIDNIQLKGAAAVFAGPIKTAAKNAVNAFIAQAVNKDDALFELLAADANAFAEKLSAS